MCNLFLSSAIFKRTISICKRHMIITTINISPYNVIAWGKLRIKHVRGVLFCFIFLSLGHIFMFFKVFHQTSIFEKLGTRILKSKLVSSIKQRNGKGGWLKITLQYINSLIELICVINSLLCYDSILLYSHSSIYTYDINVLITISLEII